MGGVAGKDPCQAPAQEHSGPSNYPELGLASCANNASQDEEGHGVGNQVLEGAMQEGCPNYSRQASEVPRDNAVLVQVAVPKQIIDHENHPTKAHERNDWAEPFNHRLATNPGDSTVIFSAAILVNVNA
jgi:hypothetical protein